MINHHQINRAAKRSNIATGTMSTVIGPADSSLYSQLAAAQHNGRPPLPGRATNRVSAPADLQQQLRAFAAGQPISRPTAGSHPLMGAMPPGGSSTFLPFSAELVGRQPARAQPAVSSNPFVLFLERHASAAWAPQDGQVLWRCIQNRATMSCRLSDVRTECTTCRQGRYISAKVHIDLVDAGDATPRGSSWS